MLSPTEELILYISDDNSYKKASFDISSFGTFIKNYVASKINPEHKVASVLALLTPVLLSRAGFPRLSLILGAAKYIFGFDLSAIFVKIGEILEPILNSGKEITKETISSAVSSAVDGGSTSTASYKDVELIKQANTFIKIAKLDKSTFGSGLKSMLTFVVTTVLIAAGFTVAGDLAKKMLGVDNDIDKANQPTQSKPSSNYENVSSTPVGNLKLNPSYKVESYNKDSIWTESTKDIPNMLFNFAVTVYPELKNYKSKILSNPKFNLLVSEINKYNSRGNNLFTYIPQEFNSKKEIVDLFAGDIDLDNSSSNNSSNEEKSSSKGKVLSI